MTPIELEIKEWLRQFLLRSLERSKKVSAFKGVPAIIVRETELEDFLDEMWIFINKQKMNNGSEEK